MTRINVDTLVLTIETLPWQECKRLVEECNGRNRPLSAAHMDKLAKDARGRRWPLTHQGIAFDPKGQIIDGQHRLAAHAKAQSDLTTVVCRYKTMRAAEDAMIVFDAGRARRVSDSLTISGVMKKETAKDSTAIAVLLVSLIDGIDASKHSGAFSVESSYRSYHEAIDWSVTALPGKRFTSPIRASFAMAWLVDRQKTAELAAQIREGSATPGSASALWNRAWTDGLLQASGGYGARRDACLRALRIIKAHILGEKPPERLYTKEDAMMWFRSAITGESPPPESADPSAPPPTWEQRILSVLHRGGTWSTSAVAKTLVGAQPIVTSMLAQMAAMGQIRRVSRGVYSALASAA
jgi:hypothetical protein